MHKSTFRVLGAAAAAAALTVSLASSATAAAPPRPPKYTEGLTSGGGGTLRVKFFEHENSGGYWFSYSGSSACSSSLTDWDYSKSVMPAGWNDQVSSIQDFNSCDVKLYWDENFKGRTSNWVDSGTGGKNVPSGWNDQLSSFRVS